jgi:hypothetical protein
MINQELIPLLACCTVRIAVPSGEFGTGFFIAPGWIVTCAHVVEDGSQTVDILWKDIRNNEVKEKVLTAEVKLVFRESSDIAFLKLTTDVKHPCVYIDSNHPQTDDLLYIFGYPAGYLEDYSAGDAITIRYEGESISRNHGILLKLKQGQIKPGFSGSPLLNMRTGGVVGIITTTRDQDLDMGGRAVPTSMIYPSPKLSNLSIADRKQLLEIIEGNRKSNKHNKRWQKISNWNKNISRTALIIALTALLGFIYLFLIPPEDLIILSFVRLIIASALGYAVFLILKGKDIDINQLRGLPIKSLATFSTVIISLLASFILIPDKPIFLRNLTGTSEYPVLSLVNEEFPRPLSQVLSLKNTPIIETKNSVYDSIQTFRNESGNQRLISEKYSNKEGINIRSDFNDRRITQRISLVGRGSRGEAVNTSQDQKDFEKDTVSYLGENYEFHYSSIISPMQISLDDAPWTSALSFISSTYDELADTASHNFLFLQYPKLSSARYFAAYSESRDLNNHWIKNIIEANPDTRGFLGFIHRYTASVPSDKKDILSLFRGACGITFISALSPTPYVRFLDIRNNSFSSVKIESLKRQTLQKGKYEITPVDEREKLFQNIEPKDDPINISILPGQNLFIPIEFGFDTRGMKKEHITSLTDSAKDNLFNDLPKELFFGIPPQSSREELLNKTRDDLIKTVILPAKLAPNYLAELKSRKQLEESIPNRFGVGSLMNIKAIRVNGKDILTDTPLSDPRFSMSVSFGYGSCPYLMVYDSEKGYWKQLGTVITDRNDISLKGSEVHLLGDSSTKFKIEERDNEITYLDSLSLLYKDSGNQTHEALLNIPTLDKLDKDYYILHQGEVLNIDVRRFLPAHAKDIQLKVNGYYQILEPSKMIAN